MKSVREARWTEILTQQVIPVSRAHKGGRGRLFGQILAGIGLVVICALFAGRVHIESITLRYRVARLVELKENLTQTRDALEIERQMLRSPQRVSRMAEGEFGMGIPEPEHRVVYP